MNELVLIENGKAHASSLMVAEKFGKEHKTVIRKIKQIIEMDKVFGEHNFVLTSYTTGQNKTHDCFTMSRDGFCMLAMGFTGTLAFEWKVKFINAFNKMEEALSSTAPTLSYLNEIVKLCEHDKDIASKCGSILSKYKKKKKENSKKLNDAIGVVQQTLNFD